MDKGFDISRMDKGLMRGYLVGVKEEAAKIRKAMKENDARAFHQAVAALQKELDHVRQIAAYVNTVNY